MIAIECCSSCGLSKPIVNKTHKLCNECNRVRLDSQSKSERNKNTFLAIKNSKPLKQISKKQSVVKKTLTQIYQQISEERPHICTGCGSSDQLTHSHIIRRSHRKDLECDIRNITYHCLHCHPIWESNEKWRLNDFEQNMEYIKEVDIEYYNLVNSKLS